MSHNYQYESHKKGPSWVAIILMLIIFWPIGLYLLWKRIKVDRGIMLRSGRFAKFFGICSIGLGLIFVLGWIADGGDREIFSMMIFFLGLGIALYAVGKKTNERAARIKRYIGLIANQHMTNLDDLARAVNVNYNIVYDDINQLLQLGYFEGAYINQQERRIVLPRPVMPNEMQDHQQNRGQNKGPNRGQGQRRGPAPTKAIICKNCGASIIVAQGTARKCEYCGSPVQG